jgi:hypothetical protein
VHRADHSGLAHQLDVVPPTCLDQDHARTGVGEAAGDDRTGAARADDDVISRAHQRNVRP